jgi:3-hydroxyisobutyrate dehydrogenase-like beta-hydroxyacid dehydrogenase
MNSVDGYTKENVLKSKLGFIGLGMMGDPMAQNLIKKSFNLMVYDIRKEAMEKMFALGAKLADSPSELAYCDIVFIIVNTGSQVKDVLVGDKGILEGIRDNQILKVVVMSTISPMIVKEIASITSYKNLSIIDAPVSGAPIGAQRGTLTFMVGGQADSVEYIRPYLQAMGKQIFHVGPLGSGLAMKLVNNMLSVTSLVVFPEALKIGLKTGLDIRTMVETIRASTGSNHCSDQWEIYLGLLSMLMKDPEYHEIFSSLLIKDIQTMLELAKGLEYESPVLRALFSMIKTSVESTGIINEELFNQFIKADI